MPRRAADILTAEYLRREYVDAGRSAREIALEVGCSAPSVRERLNRFGIPLRGAGFGHVLTAEYLQRRYVEDQATVEEIADEVGCTVPTVMGHLRRAGLKPWPGASGDRVRVGSSLAEPGLEPRQERDEPRTRSVPPPGGRRRDSKPDRRAPLTRQLLEDEYVKAGRTIHDIAGTTGYSESVISKRLSAFGIPKRHDTRKRSRDLRQLMTAEYLHLAYVLEQKTTYQIAEELGCEASTVAEYLRGYGIPIRHRH